jgi:hypothetical protein
MDSTETTSQTDANVATVQGIYEDFGRGDVPAALARMRHYTDTAKHAAAAAGTDTTAG